MTGPRECPPLPAQEIAQAFNDHGVDYLFLGKSGAILLVFPGTTQHVDVFPARSADNGRRIVAALRSLSFNISSALEAEIIAGKDFMQIKTGPFDVDLVFAPDGIAGFAEAESRALREGVFRVANLRDLIASKRASGRKKDQVDLPVLESFRVEYEKDGIRSRWTSFAGRLSRGFRSKCSMRQREIKGAPVSFLLDLRRR